MECGGRPRGELIQAQETKRPGQWTSNRGTQIATLNTRREEPDHPTEDWRRVWVIVEDVVAHVDWSGRKLPNRNEWLRARHVHPEIFDEDRNTWERINKPRNQYVSDRRRSKTILCMAN